MSSRANCVACDEIPGNISMSGSALVSKMFQDITGLNVLHHYTICKTCQQELRSCYNFRKRCHEIYELYSTQMKEVPNSSKDTASTQLYQTEESSKALENPLATTEVTIKNENAGNSRALTFQNEDFHNEDEDMDEVQDDDLESAYHFDEINPPITDDDEDDDDEVYNEQDCSDTTSSRFDCDECSKSFTKRSRLVAHKAEHRNERMYTCPRPNCNSAFNVLHRLTRHLRNVHDANNEEINESTFALVEDKEGVYIVRNNWIFFKDGGPHILYPPSTSHVPNQILSLSELSEKPDDDWVQYQVKILRQKISSYEMAKQLYFIHMQKRNPKMDLEMPPNKKFKCNPRQNTENEKIKLMELRFNVQLQELKNKLNLLLNTVGKNVPNASMQDAVDEEYCAPKAISCESEFFEMERNLIEYDRNPQISSEFSIKRESMINYYATKIKNVNKRTNPKIGLIGSLLNLYFTPDFLNQIGWTNVQGRVACKEMVGHISLFFEIVNRNMLTYVNMEEASTALYTFLRRFHESKNAKHRVKDSAPTKSGNNLISYYPSKPISDCITKEEQVFNEK